MILMPSELTFKMRLGWDTSRKSSILRVFCLLDLERLAQHHMQLLEGLPITCAEACTTTITSFSKLL